MASMHFGLVFFCALYNRFLCNATKMHIFAGVG